MTGSLSFNHGQQTSQAARHQGNLRYCGRVGTARRALRSRRGSRTTTALVTLFNPSASQVTCCEHMVKRWSLFTASRQGSVTDPLSPMRQRPLRGIGIGPRINRAQVVEMWSFWLMTGFRMVFITCSDQTLTVGLAGLAAIATAQSAAFAGRLQGSKAALFYWMRKRAGVSLLMDWLDSLHRRSFRQLQSSGSELPTGECRSARAFTATCSRALYLVPAHPYRAVHV